ncbi:hypothetical protein CCR97_23500 [Rhodoplanes elegans]|nr:hypothetical protein [Rhodoplanes elegans]
MAGLVPAIHDGTAFGVLGRTVAAEADVDGRDEPDHDGVGDTGFVDPDCGVALHRRGAVVEVL